MEKISLDVQEGEELILVCQKTAGEDQAVHAKPTQTCDWRLHSSAADLQVNHSRLILRCDKQAAVLLLTLH